MNTIFPLGEPSSPQNNRDTRLIFLKKNNIEPKTFPDLLNCKNEFWEIFVDLINEEGNKQKRIIELTDQYNRLLKIIENKKEESTLFLQMVNFIKEDGDKGSYLSTTVGYFTRLLDTHPLPEKWDVIIKALEYSRGYELINLTHILEANPNQDQWNVVVSVIDHNMKKGLNLEKSLQGLSMLFSKEYHPGIQDEQWTYFARVMNNRKEYLNSCKLYIRFAIILDANPNKEQWDVLINELSKCETSGWLWNTEKVLNAFSTLISANPDKENLELVLKFITNLPEEEREVSPFIKFGEMLTGSFEGPSLLESKVKNTGPDHISEEESQYVIHHMGNSFQDISDEEFFHVSLILEEIAADTFTEILKIDSERENLKQFINFVNSSENKKEVLESIAAFYKASSKLNLHVTHKEGFTILRNHVSGKYKLEQLPGNARDALRILLEDTENRSKIIKLLSLQI